MLSTRLHLPVLIILFIYLFMDYLTMLLIAHIIQCLKTDD